MNHLESRLNYLDLSKDRTYINVEPVSIPGHIGGNLPTGPTVPAIPKSTDVKHIQEPSYSTILQLQNLARNTNGGLEGISAQLYKTTSSLYSSTYTRTSYSELENLRDPEEYPTSPPSPVSSSYSELRQAIRHGNYDYERSLPRKNISYKSPPSSSCSSGDSSGSNEYFGLCAKCSCRIVGEGSGCTAMGRIYHISCFTCHNCDVRLQGKPFYALDGKPFCQTDYLNTLEKCCKCMRPILDRILRATGKPYHPGCFTCLVCGQSLDGIPFTVDATNQIHCIEDFHRRFAPRCSVCKNPIMPEEGQEETVRVVALDRSFHVNCYRCEDCALLLSSESQGRGCYPLDDHVLCKNCNTKRIQALTYGIGPN